MVFQRGEWTANKRETALAAHIKYLIWSLAKDPPVTAPGCRSGKAGQQLLNNYGNFWNPVTFGT